MRLYKEVNHIVEAKSTERGRGMTDEEIVKRAKDAEK